VKLSRLTLLILIAATAKTASGQEMEPRAYSVKVAWAKGVTTRIGDNLNTIALRGNTPGSNEH
jgi:hypothetical protein